MKNRILHSALTVPAFAAGLFTTANAAGRPPADRPAKQALNIVLLVSDDHGVEALGCYGNPVIKTPNLDALSSEGTRFTQAFCTSASCSPSRAAILTGLHSHATGAYGLAHSFHHFSCFEGTRTLPAILKEAGYRTGRVGKVHYAPEHLFPFSLNPYQGEYDRDDVRMAEACRDFIEQDDPFFLYWCSWNPHRGKGPLETHPLKPNRFGNPDEAYPGDTERVYCEQEVLVPPFLSDTPEVRAELAQYYQSISRLDRGIGRLIEILKDAGKYENTLIVYISDNGSAFPGSKTTLYEPGMRLPCIVRNPGQKNRGVVSDALISWLDITPTLLDFAGVPAKDLAFHGKSFRSVLEQESPQEWREEIFASHTFHQVTGYYPMRVVRAHRYKLIWNLAHPLTYPFSDDLWASATWNAVRRDRPDVFGARTVESYLHRPQFELYDLQADPDETVNLAGLPEYAIVQAKMIELMKAYQQATDDPWAQKWIHE